MPSHSSQYKMMLRASLAALLLCGALEAQRLNWIAAGSPSARAGAGMAYDAGTNSAVLFGGVGSTVQGDTWIWRGGWLQLHPSSSPSARSDMAMAYDAAAGNLVLFGGGNSGT